MTIAELQTLRTNILAALNGTLETGIVSYGLNGKQIQKMNPADLFKMLSTVEVMIGRYTTGSFSVARFRDPE
jgi:hypothetical protein